MKEGELRLNQADQCKKLGCKLLQEKPYFLCTIKFGIRNSGQHSKTARPKVINDYKSEIPAECTLEYYSG